MANSLLSAAATHSLMDEDNLLLLQDVSLQDEPEPAGGTAVGISLPNEGIDSNAPVMESPISHNNSILLQNEAAMSKNEPGFSPFAGSDTSSDFCKLDEETTKPADIGEKSSNLFQSSADSQTNFASSLFQTFTGFAKDPFQISMVPPPTQTTAPSTFSSVPLTSTTQLPSNYAHIPSSSTPNNTVSPFGTYNPLLMTTTQITPVTFSQLTYSQPPMANITKPAFNPYSQSTINSSTYPQLTQTSFEGKTPPLPMYNPNTMITTSITPITFAPQSSSYSTLNQNNSNSAASHSASGGTFNLSATGNPDLFRTTQGGLTSNSSVPLFNTNIDKYQPESTHKMETTLSSPALFVPAANDVSPFEDVLTNFATTGSTAMSFSSYGQTTVGTNSYVPLNTTPSVPPQQLLSTAVSSTPLYNPVITPNTSSEGFTVLPPKAEPLLNSDGSNQFRRTSQKLLYASHPGINSAGNVQSYTAPPIQDLSKLSEQTLIGTPVQQSQPGVANLLYNTNSHIFSPSSGFGTSRQQPNQIFQYSTVQYHWFFNREIDGRPIWKPFSMIDSSALEAAFSTEPPDLVSTDGGRYDVDIPGRVRLPVYWEEKHPAEVRRCSWFYKGPLDSRFTPYDEQFSATLEAEYYQQLSAGVWHKRLELGGGEVILMHSPATMFHFCQAASPDEWGNMPENQLRPRVVKRGVADFEIEQGESNQVDHLVLIVHGVGSVCDFKFRDVIEAAEIVSLVDEFRGISHQLMPSHFKETTSGNPVGRIEFLPIQWHSALHGDGGIDKKLRPITLKSIPKLRDFANDTLLDILFYTSPVYSQTIIDTVSSEINRIYGLFCKRNSNFNGMVALGGHSLGSLIIFDILTHQPETLPEKDASGNTVNHKAETVDKSTPVGEEIIITPSGKEGDKYRMVTYQIGPAGSAVELINYPVLDFHPTAFFAMGSPIAMFATVRGSDQLGTDFHFPTVSTFFNIFHPFDPVAYRIEPLIDPSLDLRPVLIPHHKGRKRLHLELKETMARVGAELKSKVMESVKTTWNMLYQLASFGRPENLEQDIDNVIQEFPSGFEEEVLPVNDVAQQETFTGKLNSGRRVDYVLQESPMEILNEYVFALSSHVGYWSSEDTVLLVMKEIYQKLGVSFNAACTNLPPPQPPQDANLPSTSFMQQPPPLNSNNTGLIPTQGYTSPFTNSNNINTYQVQSPPEDQATPTFYNFSSGPSLVPGLKSTKTILGARPVVSPDQFPGAVGMDPTAPISSNVRIGPPPLSGFVGSRKN